MWREVVPPQTDLMAHILLPYLTIVSRQEITRGIAAELLNRLEETQSTKLIVKIDRKSVV